MLSGIPQINADMIQDLPLISKSYNERLQRDLEKITAIGPHHITWYNMRLRPETTYAHMEIVVPSERESLLTRLTIWNYLEGNGYKILEGDRFAKEEKNEDKFRKTRGSVKSQLIGMGVSAYSHVPGENFGQREGFFFQNSRDIGKRVREDSRQAVADYIRKVQEHGHAITFGYPLTVDEEIAGTFALGLKKGVDLPAVTEYIETTPEGAAYSRAVLTDLISLLGAGLIIIEDGIMKFSRTGRLFENELSAKFYTPRAKYLALQRRKQESENKVASAVHQKSLPILKVKTEVGPSDTDRISTVSYETSIALNRVMTEQRGF